MISPLCTPVGKEMPGFRRGLAWERLVSEGGNAGWVTVGIVLVWICWIEVRMKSIMDVR